ncbi:Transposase IS116/IS110/IS902 family protein [compost metagenome]
MLEFPSSQDILKAREETIVDKIFELCKSRSLRWAREKAIQLKAVAARNPFEKTVYQSHILSLGMYINILLQYKEHPSKLEAEIDTLAKEMEEYNIIKSIPGIGEKIAATIISEIGEIDRFTDPKINPRTPSISKPIYILINAVKALIPRLAPKILGSMILRIIVITANRMSKPIAKRELSVISSYRAHGTMKEPVPKIG